MYAPSGRLSCLAFLAAGLVTLAAATVEAPQMQQDSAIRGCSNWSWWNPVYQPDPNSCANYCAQNGADACEWYQNGDCYVEFGDGCYVQSGWAGWWAGVVSSPPPPPSQMQQDSAIRGCSNWSWWNPVYQPDPNSCANYCVQNGANACEWYENGDCYVEFGSGCYVQSGWAGWWAAVFSSPPTGVRRVVDYGAQCNGVADDRTAIQNAFNAAQSGESVEFPAGTCVYSSNIELIGKSNLTVYGAGMDSTVLSASNPASASFRIGGSSNITVRDLQVYSPNSTGRNQPDDGGSNFVVAGGANVQFWRVRARRAAAVGILFYGVAGGGVWDSVVRDTWADGIHMSHGSHDLTISNNRAHGTGDDSYACVGYVGDGQNWNISIVGNKSVDSLSSGVTVEGCENVTVDSNEVSGSGYIGIRAVSGGWGPGTGRVNEVNIRWNSVTESGEYGVPSIMLHAQSGEVANIHVIGNTIVSPYYWVAIHVLGENGNYVHDSQIENNTITGAYQCVSVQGTTYNISVANNSCG